MFVKGKSGNPGGRSKASRELGRHVREKTNDGHDLIDRHCSIARGEPLLRMKRGNEYLVQLGGSVPKGCKLVSVLWPCFDDMQRSIAWLGTRGFGKPEQSIELHVEDSALTKEQQAEELVIIGREYVLGLAEEERAKLLASLDPAPSPTIQ